MKVAPPARRSLFVALLLPGTALAVGVAERPLPDGSAIEEVLRGTGQPEGRYVSARAVEHYLRARLAQEDGILEQAEAELALASVYDPQSAWPRYAMAVEHLRQGEVSEAEKDLRVALQVDPGHSPSLRLRARLLLDQGRLSQAVAALENATRSDPHDPEPFALLVRAHLAQSRFTEARAAVQRLDAIAAGVRDGERVSVDHALALAARSHEALAEALEGAGRFEEAEISFRSSLDRQPGDVARVDALVRFLEARGRFDEAARLAARSLGVAGPQPHRLLRVARLLIEAGQPKAAAAYVRLAVDSRQEGPAFDGLVAIGASLLAADELEVALEAFEAALSLAPEREDARWYAALASEQLGRFEDAIAHYRMVSAGSRLTTLAAARAAWCEHRLGRHEPARQTLAALVDAAPDDEDLLLLFARMREGLGEGAAAIAQVEAQLVRKPTRRLMLELAGMYRRQQRGADAVALLELERRAAPADQAVAWSLAQSLAAAGRTDRAIAEAKALLGRHPARGEVANFVGWLLAEQGKAEEAESFAWLALELEPERWEYLDTLGWAQLKAGNASAAVATLQKARAQAPEDLDVALHLAEALTAAGRASEARPLLQDVTRRTLSPALATRHERAARLLETLAASSAPTADASNAPVAP